MTTNQTIDASSIDNEKMVLGSILSHPESASICFARLNEEDFFEPKHKTIFGAAKLVFNEKKVVDTHLVAEHLKQHGGHKEIGGISYIIDLAQYAGTSCHIESYAEDLRTLTLKRHLASLHNALATDLKQNADPAKIIDKLKDKISSIEERKEQADSSFRFLLDNNSEQSLIDELKTTSPGISTGFKIGEVDLKIPGGAISVVAAPTSHGKTSTLINFALGALNHHHDISVYFFTYEECQAAILSLFLNTWMNKDFSKNNRESIESYFRDSTDKYITSNAREDFARNKTAFFETLIDTGRLKVVYSEMSAEELVASIRFIRKHTNVGLICIDYMQFIRLLRNTSLSRQEELKRICLMLKDCAIETGLPILLAAQFNRQVTCEADISPINIGEAGDIERIASLILGMWNRNFEGFTKDGNQTKNGQTVPKASAIYFEIMKGRKIGAGHSAVMNFNGNTGKLTEQVNITIQAPPKSHGERK